MLQYLSKQLEGTTSPYKLTKFLRALPQCSAADHADHPVQDPYLLWTSLTKAALNLRISCNSGATPLKSASTRKQVGKGWKGLLPPLLGWIYMQDLRRRNSST